MEILFVYGLVLLFFILIPLFVVVVLSTHPYAELPQTKQENKTATTSGSASLMNSKVVYSTLAIIFMSLCVIAMLSERRAHAGA
jgi:hypothetical protein